MLKIITHILLLIIVNPILALDPTLSSEITLLEKIQEKTTEIKDEQENFSQKFLNEYLQINRPTEDNNYEIIPKLLETEKNITIKTYAESQKIINNILSGSNFIENEMKENGKFSKIAPIGDNNAPDNMSLNVNSILAYNTISGIESNKVPATNFPLILTQAIPSETIKDESKMSQQAYTKYISGVWAENAARSIALSNIYHVLFQRQEFSGLGEAAGLTDEQGQPKKNASIMEIEEFLINQRIGNKEWYEKMANASPKELAREQLFILAEIQRLMYKSKEQNDRISLAMAALISQGTELRKIITDMQESALASAKDSVSAVDGYDY